MRLCNVAKTSNKWFWVDLIDDFEWITSQFNKYFIKNYPEETDGGYFLEIDVQYPEIASSSK